MSFSEFEGAGVDNQAVFDVTDKGEREIRSLMVNVLGDAKFVLPLFGKGLNLAEILLKLPPSACASFDNTVNKLLESGYIALATQASIQQYARNRRAGDDQACLDFTGRHLSATPDMAMDVAAGKQAETDAHTEALARRIAEQELLKVRAETETLKQEIESRSQKLASSKINQFEQDMNHTISMMVEHELFRVEEEKQARQQEMVETARLSPMYELLRELAFFRDFNAAELAEVLHIAVWSEMEKHQVILQVGCQTRSFFVMMNGSAAVLRNSRMIGVVESGESFGDGFYLMGEQPNHYASVISTSHVEYLEFLTEPLEAASLEVRYQFARALARSQTTRFRRANEQLVNLLTDKTHD